MQRIVKKAVVSGVVGLAVASVLTAAAAAPPAHSQAVTLVASTVELPSTTDRGAVTAAVAHTPKRAASYRYSQAGDTVTVYQRGKTVARLRLTSARYHGTTGQVTLRVHAKRDFTFTAGEFIWEYPGGADNSPLCPSKLLRVGQGSTRTITLTYQNVGSGDVIWAPSFDIVAGVWSVPAH
jgi:hypothetical protein